MRHVKAFLLVVILMAVLLTACQSTFVAEAPTATPEPTATDTPAPTNTPEPTATPAPTSTPTLTPTPTPEVLSEDELSELMLTLDDLTSGFTVDEEGTGPLTREDLVEQEAEKTLGYLDEAGEWASYEAAFERLTLANLAVVSSWAIAFDSEEQAADYLDNIDKFFAEDFDPVVISFEKVGEEKAAYKGQLEESGYTFDAYYIAFRRRNIIMTLRYVTIAGLSDTDEVAEYALILDGRLVDKVGGE